MSTLDNRKPLRLGYIGVGKYLPEKILTNADLERMVDTSDEWIKQRTGIRTRHIMSRTDSIANMAIQAAERAIEQAGIDRNQITALQVGCNTHLRFPSLAAIVAKNLGIKGSNGADVSAGCSAYLYSVENVVNKLQADWFLTGENGYGLVIGVDALSTIVDWEDRGTCVLFGDGAGATVIGTVEEGGIMATYTRTHGENDDLLYLDDVLLNPLEDTEEINLIKTQSIVYPFLRMDGRKVFKVAVRSMMADIRSVIEKYNRMGQEQVTLSDISYVIPHQANLRIVSAVQEGLGLPEDMVYSDGVINYGNTSAATIPIGICDTWGKNPGQLIVDVAFGAGFASGAVLRRNPK